MAFKHSGPVFLAVSAAGAWAGKDFIPRYASIAPKTQELWAEYTLDSIKNLKEELGQNPTLPKIKAKFSQLPADSGAFENWLKKKGISNASSHAANLRSAAQDISTSPYHGMVNGFNSLLEMFSAGGIRESSFEELKELKVLLRELDIALKNKSNFEDEEKRLLDFISKEENLPAVRILIAGACISPKKFADGNYQHIIDYFSGKLNFLKNVDKRTEFLYMLYRSCFWVDNIAKNSPVEFAPYTRANLNEIFKFGFEVSEQCEGEWARVPSHLEGLRPLVYDWIIKADDAFARGIDVLERGMRKWAKNTNKDASAVTGFSINKDAVLAGLEERSLNDVLKDSEFREVVWELKDNDTGEYLFRDAFNNDKKNMTESYVSSNFWSGDRSDIRYSKIAYLFDKLLAAASMWVVWDTVLMPFLESVRHNKDTQYITWNNSGGRKILHNNLIGGQLDEQFKKYLPKFFACGFATHELVLDWRLIRKGWYDAVDEQIMGVDPLKYYYGSPHKHSLIPEDEKIRQLCAMPLDYILAIYPLMPWHGKHVTYSTNAHAHQLLEFYARKYRDQEEIEFNKEEAYPKRPDVSNYDESALNEIIPKLLPDGSWEQDKIYKVAYRKIEKNEVGDIVSIDIKYSNSTKGDPNINITYQEAKDGGYGEPFFYLPMYDKDGREILEEKDEINHDPEYKTDNETNRKRHVDWTDRRKKYSSEANRRVEKTNYPSFDLFNMHRKISVTEETLQLPQISIYPVGYVPVLKDGESFTFNYKFSIFSSVFDPKSKIPQDVETVIIAPTNKGIRNANGSRYVGKLKGYEGCYASFTIVSPFDKDYPGRMGINTKKDDYGTVTFEIGEKILPSTKLPNTLQYYSQDHTSEKLQDEEGNIVDADSFHIKAGFGAQHEYAIISAGASPILGGGEQIAGPGYDFRGWQPYLIEDQLEEDKRTIVNPGVKFYVDRTKELEYWISCSESRGVSQVVRPLPRSGGIVSTGGEIIAKSTKKMHNGQAVINQSYGWFGIRSQVKLPSNIDRLVCSIDKEGNYATEEYIYPARNTPVLASAISIHTISSGDIFLKIHGKKGKPIVLKFSEKSLRTVEYLPPNETIPAESTKDTLEYELVDPSNKNFAIGKVWAYYDLKTGKYMGAKTKIYFNDLLSDENKGKYSRFVYKTKTEDVGYLAEPLIMRGDGLGKYLISFDLDTESEQYVASNTLLLGESEEAGDVIWTINTKNSLPMKFESTLLPENSPVAQSLKQEYNDPDAQVYELKYGGVPIYNAIRYFDKEEKKFKRDIKRIESENFDKFLNMISTGGNTLSYGGDKSYGEHGLYGGIWNYIPTKTYGDMIG
ncbi:MAG: hypothetical protein ABIH83_01745 [Candidatus Micrarchaeota archaeon]